MKRINIIGNIMLFVVVALIIYLSPNFINYISLFNIQRQETNIRNAYLEQQNERVSVMQRSVAHLGIKDKKLLACIEKEAEERAGIDPRSTGGRYSASELDILTCPGLGIRSLDGLEGMSKLRSIILFRNEIRDLNPLSNLHALERLDISYNKVVDISPLTNLHKLTRLNLNGNSVTNVRLLGEMPNLTSLGLPDLQGILCADLEYLQSFSHISHNSNFHVIHCRGRKEPKIAEILAKDRSEWTPQEEEAYLYYKINERKKKLYPRKKP